MEPTIPDPFVNRGTFYQILDHTADLGIRVFGNSLPELFANAGFSLFDLIADPGSVDVDGTVSFTVEGNDWPDLMVNYLRELLYLWSGEEKLVCGIRLRKLSEYQLTAEIDFAYYDPKRHRIRQEIKAVTYHGIRVERCGQKIFSEIILDI
jgi:SHS2 domain-containing protein